MRLERKVTKYEPKISSDGSIHFFELYEYKPKKHNRKGSKRDLRRRVK